MEKHTLSESSLNRGIDLTRLKRLVEGMDLVKVVHTPPSSSVLGSSVSFPLVLNVTLFSCILLWFVFLSHTLLLVFHFRSHSWLAPLSPQRVSFFTEIWMRSITRSRINCHVRDIETRTSQKKIDWKDSSKKHRLESRWNGLARWHGRPNDTKRVTIVEETTEDEKRDWHKRDERQD